MGGLAPTKVASGESGKIRSGDGSAGHGDFGIDVLAEAIQIGLKTGAHAVARGQRDYSDLPVLQHSEDTAEKG